MNSYWLLLLPIAASFGYVSSAYKRSHWRAKLKKHSKKTTSSYLADLSLLPNEQDTAVERFVQSLSVDSDTIETHLALGNLYRRKGEVDRAIRIHQNLVGQSQLTHELRTQALYALAKDYLSAGVLDRAEQLFLELIEQGVHLKSSYRALLYIYQQEKEWEQAIAIAQKLAASSENTMQVEVAQYHCELAELASKQKEYDQAYRYLKKALAINSKCARASLQLAELDLRERQWDKALRSLRKIEEQDADFLYLAVGKQQQAYLALQQAEEFIEYLQQVLEDHPQMPIVITLSEQIRQLHGDQAALHFISEFVKRNPSLAGLHDLLSLQLLAREGKAREDLELLHTLTERLLQDRKAYLCVNCGFGSNAIHWHCPSCKQWETTKPAFLVDEHP